MLAPTRDLVADLNTRAREHRLQTTPQARGARYNSATAIRPRRAT